MWGADYKLKTDAEKQAHLAEKHVLAIRLYSSSVFENINGPLRRGCSVENPHPYPALVGILNSAINSLVRMQLTTFPPPFSLWRGMGFDLTVPDKLVEKGGTELAFCSFSMDRSVAENYASKDEHKEHLLLLEVQIHEGEGLNSGADISMFSVFPKERELLFPTRTFFKPVRQMHVLREEKLPLKRENTRGETVLLAERNVEVFAVEPRWKPD